MCSKIFCIDWYIVDYNCLNYKLDNCLHASCHSLIVVIVVPRVSGWSVTLPCLPICLHSVFLWLSFFNLATHSFSRLFSSSSSVPTMKKAESQSSVKYNTPGSLVKRSSTFSQFPTEKSKTFDFLNEEWVAYTSLKRLFSVILRQCVSLHWILLFYFQNDQMLFIVHQLTSALLAEKTCAAHHHVKSRREPSTDRSRPTCRRRTDESRRTAGACPTNTRWENNSNNISMVLFTLTEPPSYSCVWKSNCALVFVLYLLIGGKWWAGRHQNKPTCTSILEASGTKWCFYEGAEVNDLITFYRQHMPSSFSTFADIFPFLYVLLPFLAVVCCRREPLRGEGSICVRTHQTGPGFSE